MSSDPLATVSRGLQQASTGLLIGKGATSTALSGLSDILGTVDLFDQEVPVLGLITDGLTVATGIGSLVASAFDTGPKAPSPIKAPVEASVGQQYGE